VHARACGGGVYNPIIPVFNKPPDEWKSEGYERWTMRFLHMLVAVGPSLVVVGEFRVLSLLRMRPSKSISICCHLIKLGGNIGKDAMRGVL
jgi:hypothetical protein